MYTRNEHEPVAGELIRAALSAPMLDAATERSYLERIQRDDDPEAMDLLLASHLRLVVSIARKYSRQGVAPEDLIAEGNLGLVEAVRRFDLSRDIRFATYAAWWVRALVQRAALENRRVVGAPSTRAARRVMSRLRSTQARLHARDGAPPTREQVASALDVSVDDVAMVEAALGARDVSLTPRDDGGALELATDQTSPEDEVADREALAWNRRVLREAIQRLAARERVIVEERLQEDDAPTLAQLGTKLGLSRERVRQLENGAHARLRAALEGRVAMG
jgi:RNA polymerase sigma-32 factor